jgi:hypothetical protein
MRHLAAGCGWTEEEMSTVSAYEGSEAVYFFPTMGEATASMRGLFCPPSLFTPSYELGSRCPVLSVRRLP